MKIFVIACTLAACSLLVGLKQAGAQSAAPERAGAYYMSEFEVTDAEGIRPYSAAVESTFLPFGGRYVVRGGQVSSLEGAQPKRIIVIGFPSMERAQAWYDSEAYRAIRPIRHRTANSRVFTLEALPK